MNNLEGKTYGQIAFEGYIAVKPVAVGGNVVPPWAEVSYEVRAAWEAAAGALMALMVKPDVEVDSREQSEIMLALHYGVEFNHGTAGHNRLMLIAKLAGAAGFDYFYGDEGIELEIPNGFKQV